MYMGGPLINQLIGVKIAGVILVQQSPTLLKKQREGKLNYFKFIQTVLLLPSKHAQNTNYYEDI